MKKIIIGALITLTVVLVFRYFENQKEESEQIIENSALIQREIKNVGKLIVTEGSFSQVFTFKNDKKFYLDIFSASKKAIVIVNAKVTIAYDLRKIETEINEKEKIVRIKQIPEPELNIYPNIEYYDVTQDYLNQFDEEDYNKIKKKVAQNIQEKIKKSDLKDNAQNRLISELQKIYILTNTLNWTLVYDENIIENEQELQKIQF
ncbi:MAG TPA: DUF4230 domain-containing protein [Salinimicrobium sp.]|nr:DUF4230 domain-containing protein [Salinimicrobium sp.]